MVLHGYESGVRRHRERRLIKHMWHWLSPQRCCLSTEMFNEATTLWVPRHCHNLMGTLRQNEIIQSQRSVVPQYLCPLPKSVHKTTVCTGASAVGPEHAKRVTPMMKVSRTELLSSLNKRQKSTCDQHHLITWITWRTKRPRALLKQSKFKCESRERTHTFLFENNPKRACKKNTHTIGRLVADRGHARGLPPIKCPKSEPNVVPVTQKMKMNCPIKTIHN